jgi:hypothetical protein
MVQYKVKPERVEEHEALLRAVFTELATTAPEGLRYSAYKKADGKSFVHVALITGETNPLDATAAFKAFVANVKDRCDVPPATELLTQIGAYAF